MLKALRPKRLDVEVAEGANLELLYQWFKDKAETTPENLEGLTFQFELLNGPTLTEGTGVVVKVAEGKVEVSAPSVAASWNGPYRLAVKEGSGKKQYPAWGEFNVLQPPGINRD